MASSVQLTRQPRTRQYLEEELGRLKNRKPAPALQPSARVLEPERQQSGLTPYYQRLNTIEQSGNAALSSQRMKAAASRRLASTVPTGALTTGGVVPANPAANFKFAQEMAGQYGWDAAQLQAWYNLGMKESGWRHTAQNPKSTAFGIGQFLDSTWKTVGGTKTSDPRAQVDMMAKYIKQRYGTPAAALAYHLRNNWY